MYKYKLKLDVGLTVEKDGGVLLHNSVLLRFRVGRACEHSVYCVEIFRTTPRISTESGTAMNLYNS